MRKSSISKSMLDQKLIHFVTSQLPIPQCPDPGLFRKSPSNSNSRKPLAVSWTGGQRLTINPSRIGFPHANMPKVQSDVDF